VAAGFWIWLENLPRSSAIIWMIEGGADARRRTGKANKSRARVILKARLVNLFFGLQGYASASTPRPGASTDTDSEPSWDRPHAPRHRGTALSVLGFGVALRLFLFCPRASSLALPQFKKKLKPGGRATAPVLLFDELRPQWLFWDRLCLERDGSPPKRTAHREFRPRDGHTHCTTPCTVSTRPYTLYHYTAATTSAMTR
jgi:hypothetical protein